MTEEIEAIIRDLRSGFDREFHTAVARLRAVAPATATPTPEPVFITVGSAAFEVGLSESQVRKLCKKYPNTTPGGFGWKRAGRWVVDQECFLAFVKANPRRVRRKRK